jgi:hypothetical protein
MRKALKSRPTTRTAQQERSMETSITCHTPTTRSSSRPTPPKKIGSQE